MFVILCVTMTSQVVEWFPVLYQTDFYFSINNLQDIQLDLEACTKRIKQ